MACRLGKENLAKMLIQAGANVNAQVDDRFSSSMNCAPLHCATEKGHIDICEMLLNNGANIEAEVKPGFIMSLNTFPHQSFFGIIKSKFNVNVNGKKWLKNEFHIIGC